MLENASPKAVSWAVTISLMVIGVIGVISIAIGGSYLLTFHAIGQAQTRLCVTLQHIEDIQPPSTGDDPSRAYRKKLHDNLAALGPDIGCPIQPVSK